MQNPLTAAEWLSENSERQELAVMNIPLAMELYACYKADMEACRFAEWLTYSAQPKSISKQWWILRADKKEYTTTQLFDLFKKECNGK